MEKRELTCIGCPLGCTVMVSLDGKKVVSVEGNTCKRGYAYAVDECTDPKRTLTSTVAVNNRDEMLSVKSDKAISFKKITEAMKMLNRIAVTAPVKIGDCIISNIDGNGANLIATKNIV